MSNKLGVQRELYFTGLDISSEKEIYMSSKTFLQ